MERHVDLGEDIMDIARLDALGRERGTAARAVHGLFPLQTEADGIRIRYTWLAGLDALPYPQLGTQDDLALVADQSGFEFPAVVTLSVGDTPGAVRLSGCTLEIWGVLMQMQLNEETILSTFTHWFPQLGTGVAVREEINGELSGATSLRGMQW